jgi:hypothetical protein
VERNNSKHSLSCELRYITTSELLQVDLNEALD